MCYITVYHFTHCNTQRRAIINPITGATVFHPFEQPQQCMHGIIKLPPPADPNAGAPCPVHGTCCHVGQAFVCEGKDMTKEKCLGWQTHHRVMEPRMLEVYGTQLQPVTAEDWRVMQLKPETESFSYDEDIRIQFFDAGAKMYELAQMGRHLVQTLSQHERSNNGAKLEERDFLLHGEHYWYWMVARKELLQLTEAWENLASVGCMEFCPSKLVKVHPWMKYAFAGWNERQPVHFPQFPGIPFAFLDNIDRQEELLRWHPYYARRDMPSTPNVVDCFWSSPSVPQRYNPELALHIEQKERDMSWPAEWYGIMRGVRISLPIRSHDDDGPCHTTVGDWGTASSPSTHSSGPRTPPWAIPYGEEPDFEWDEIHWDQRATFAESPAVSPGTIPASVEEISSVPYDDRMEANLYQFERFIGTEERADREFLSVSVSDDDSDGEEKGLKRRRSEDDQVGEESGMSPTKRCRTA
ncbi:hypothetical protein FPOA_03922 [Fusarium poae]|uniref:Uncharacterized protein n=1 Tax=Fusarium poae TaxID=36050 RepID=A0A1B8AS81_FUSPO|nr:hypothetical protein FPOA_03922 [Fusarium poae]